MCQHISFPLLINNEVMVTRFNIRALFLGHQYALHKERSKVHNIQLLALCRTA
jgi:hypothetical protein